MLLVTEYRAFISEYMFLVTEFRVFITEYIGWCLGVIFGSFLTPRAALAGVVTGTQVSY